ncbi:hypothetical protein LUZ60_013766 [Juncus effusus]|nr:hypothetical protein LUZ60_013766 [Juncus effusus]
MDLSIPAPAWAQKGSLFCGKSVRKYNILKNNNGGNHYSNTVICMASKKSGKGKSMKNASVIRSASDAPQLKSGNYKSPSNNEILDQKFLNKLEEVKKSAIEKKKAEENKLYQPIDYDAPIDESNQTTISFGTKVGVGIAVVVFGLVFAFGDFIPYGSDTGKEGTEIRRQLTEEEKTTFQRAFSEYEEKLKESPNDASALEGAAVTLVELGEYDKASSFLEKLIKESPNYADAYRLLGEVKYEMKDYDASISAFKKSLSLSDKIDFDVLQGLTNTLLAAQKPEEAVQVLLSAREKINKENTENSADLNSENAQNNPKVDPIQVELLIGKAYSDWGHLSDAVSVYDKLISDHPDDFRGYLAKGLILKQNGKTGEAERMFIQARFFAPDAAKALVDRYSRK